MLTYTNVIFLTLFIVHSKCLNVKRTATIDYVTIDNPNNCPSQYDGYHGSTSSCQCGNLKKKTFLSAFKSGQPTCGGGVALSGRFIIMSEVGIVLMQQSCKESNLIASVLTCHSPSTGSYFGPAHLSLYAYFSLFNTFL